MLSAVGHLVVYFGTLRNNAPLSIHVHILVSYEKAQHSSGSIVGILSMCKVLDSISHNRLMHTYVYA